MLFTKNIIFLLSIQALAIILGGENAKEMPKLKTQIIKKTKDNRFKIETKEHSVDSGEDEDEEEDNTSEEKDQSKTKENSPIQCEGFELTRKAVACDGFELTSQCGKIMVSCSGFELTSQCGKTPVVCTGFELTNRPNPISCTGFELTGDGRKVVPCHGDFSFKTVYGGRCVSKPGQSSVSSCTEGPEGFTWCSTEQLHFRDDHWFDWDLCSLCNKNSPDQPLTPGGKQCEGNKCTAKFDDGPPGPPRCIVPISDASGDNWDYCTTCQGQDCLPPVIGTFPPGFNIGKIEWE